MKDAEQRGKNSLRCILSVVDRKRSITIADDATTKYLEDELTLIPSSNIIFMMKYKFQQRPTPKYVWLAIVLLICIAVFGFIFTQTNKPSIFPSTTIVNPTSTTTTVIPSVTKGDLVIAVKDVPQKISRIGTVYALELKVTKIEIHEAGTNESNETVGWTTIFEGTKTLDLIQFTDVVAIIGQKEFKQRPCAFNTGLQIETVVGGNPISSNRINEGWKI